MEILAWQKIAYDKIKRTARRSELCFIPDLWHVSGSLHCRLFRRINHAPNVNRQFHGKATQDIKLNFQF